MVRSVVVALASLALVGVCGEGAGAEPRPKPQQAAHTRQVRHPGGHHARHYPRPRTVVQCQSDGSDQVDEFDDQDGLPQYTFSPGGAPAAQAGECSGRMLDIARVLAGDRKTHRRPRAAAVR